MAKSQDQWNQPKPGESQQRPGYQQQKPGSGKPNTQRDKDQQGGERK
jgi:hypothetical protein